jgi:hypothetical protein
MIKSESPSLVLNTIDSSPLTTTTSIYNNNISDNYPKYKQNLRMPKHTFNPHNQNVKSIQAQFANNIKS